MQPRYDFSRFWLNESLADTLVLIRIDGDVKQRIPGHGIVLANVSNVFKQEIEQQQGLNGRPTICMDVEDDQVPAASALVRFVYTGDLPEPSANQQAVLVHMCYLAQQFDVTDCRTACLDVLMQCQQMQPAALGLAFQLLSPLVTGAVASTSTAEGSAHAGEPQAGFKALLIHCQDQLQQQLGDMEAVLDSPSQLSNLHSLPLPALLALLHDMRTSAASENTVLAAVHSWMTAAAQRDIRVDAVQREQLAAVVRIPLLEPCFLATVLPRMAWLLEILGPQGLATAAGVARGLCDPHAEPALSNARACGPLAADWLRGPRPVPASCSQATHGGPALAINWAIPLSDIRAAFEAACADAAAKVLLAQQHRQQAEAAAAAAAAAAHQAALVSSEAPGWGLGFRSPMAHASVAAGMSAVASAASAAAARVFNKRKRSCSVAESMDEGGRDQQSSSTAALAVDRARRQDRGQNRQQQVEGADAEGEAEHEQVQEQELHAVEPPMQPWPQGRSQEGEPDREDEAEGLQQHTRKRPRRGAATPADAQEAAAVHRPDSSQRVRKPASIQAQRQAAGVDGPVSPQAGALGAAAPAGAAAAGVLSQQTSAAAGVMSRRGDSLTSGSQQPPRNLKLRSPEVQFAGYAWRLVLYFQPREQPALGAGAGASGGLPVSEGPRAVAAAHAVSLPDDPGTHRSPSAPATAADLATQTWTARLAVEARPAVALQSGSSTVAFSGQLGARLVSRQRGTAARAAAGRTWARAKQGTGAGSSQQHRSQAAASGSQDAAPSPSPMRRHSKSDRQARYTCSEAAAAGAGGEQQPDECERGPSGKQQAAGDGVGRRRLRKAHAELLSIPETSEEPPEELQDSSSSLEETPQPSAVQDDDEEVVDDDLGFMMVGEYPPGAAAAAAAGGGASGAARTPRSAGRRAQQQPGSTGARRRPVSADSAGAAVTPGEAAGGHVHMDENEGGGWHVLYLPQGSWLRSRRCDTGFTNFFSIQLQQGEWDDTVWEQFLQPGGTLGLRGIISNVR